MTARWQCTHSAIKKSMFSQPVKKGDQHVQMKSVSKTGALKWVLSWSHTPAHSPTGLMSDHCQMMQPHVASKRCHHLICWHLRVPSGHDEFLLSTWMCNMTSGSFPKRSFLSLIGHDSHVHNIQSWHATLVTTGHCHAKKVWQVILLRQHKTCNTLHSKQTLKWKWHFYVLDLKHCEHCGDMNFGLVSSWMYLSLMSRPHLNFNSDPSAVTWM